MKQIDLWTDLADDAPARREALDPGRSLVLQAPAGSGKTTVLVQRFLALLAVVAEPEEILAITFTRKAAAEMRERIVAVLRAEPAPDNPQAAEYARLRAAVLRNARRRGWDLGLLPLRLRVQTIDAFNHWLASRLPVLARAGTRLVPVDDARQLYAAAARRALQDAQDEDDDDRDASLRAAADRILEKLDDDWPRAERLLADMLARRSHWLRHFAAEDADALAGRLTRQLQQSLERIAAEHLETAATCMAAHLAEGASLAADAARHLAAYLRAAGESHERAGAWLSPVDALGADPAHLAHWIDIARLALTDGGDWRKQFTIRQGFPPQERALKQRGQDWLDALKRAPGAQECLQELRRLPPTQVTLEDRATLAAFAAVLRHAALELQVIFHETGRVDHVHVAAAAREALGPLDEPTDLAMRVGVRLQHLLVDEFQDVSLDQYWLLAALTAGWQEGDGRSLFLVGDPMQSIYQFREAEVWLFLRARAEGIGSLRLEPLALRRNFRSLPLLTEWFNATFRAVFPENDDLRSAAVSYLAASPGRPLEEGAPGRVQMWAQASPDPGVEAARIVTLVREARERDPDSSIAVLLSGRAQAPAIVEALRAADIVIRGIELEPLAARPAVRDIVALLRALLHGEDRAAWLAVLRAPWCGLALRELTDLLADAPRGASIWECLNDATLVARLDAPARARLERCRDVLADGLASRGRVDLPQWLERCWLRIGGAAVCKSEQDRRDVRSFLDALATQLEDARPLTVESLDALTFELYADMQVEIEGGAPPVDILTIHAAKGLEWDVVILPGLHRTPGMDLPPLLRWLELPRPHGTGSDLIFAPLSLGEPEHARDPLARYIDALQRERTRHERRRLAYVACTRARRELHLMGHLASNAKGELRPSSTSLLHVLWPAIETVFIDKLTEDSSSGGLARQDDPAAIEDETRVLPQFLVRLPAHWQLPIPVAQPASAEPAPTPGVDGEVLQFEWVEQTARAVGTLVHAELEAFARREHLPDEHELDARRELHDTVLRQLGVADTARAAAVQRVRVALARTLHDRRGRWLLSSTHREARSELRLSGSFEQRLVNVVIDRCFVDAEGTRWVVDYKTSDHLGGDLEAFVARELQRYDSQLRQYAVLAARLGNEPVRAALYFPLLGVFRERATPAPL